VHAQPYSAPTHPPSQIQAKYRLLTTGNPQLGKVASPMPAPNAIARKSFALSNANTVGGGSQRVGRPHWLSRWPEVFWPVAYTKRGEGERLSSRSRSAQRRTPTRSTCTLTSLPAIIHVDGSRFQALYDFSDTTIGVNTIRMSGRRTRDRYLRRTHFK
jgi:hypothetical protein